jgi:ABC-type transporter Mla subunit MlaD
VGDAFDVNISLYPATLAPAAPETGSLGFAPPSQLDNPYTALGFNPAPGSLDDVSAVISQVSNAADSLGDADSLVNKLYENDTGVWQGDAADAFRKKYNDTLSVDLYHAHVSLGNAATYLKAWLKDLSSLQDQASKLNQQAAQLQEQYPPVYAAYDQARQDPNLKLAGAQVPTDQLAAAEAQFNQASDTLRSSSAAVSNLCEQYQSVLNQAKELQAQTEQLANQVKHEIDEATKHLAPHKPGILHRALHDIGAMVNDVESFVANNLHAILSDISAVAGLIALLPIPGLQEVAEGVSIAASTAALVTDIADPKFRGAVMDLLEGHMSKEDRSELMKGVGDAMGIVPFGKVATSGRELKAGLKVAEDGAALTDKALGKVDNAVNIIQSAGKSARGLRVVADGSGGERLALTLSGRLRVAADNPGLVLNQLSKRGVPGLQTAEQVNRALWAHKTFSVLNDARKNVTAAVMSNSDDGSSTSSSSSASDQGSAMVDVNAALSAAASA